MAPTAALTFGDEEWLVLRCNGHRQGNGDNDGGTFTFELDGDLISRFTIR